VTRTCERCSGPLDSTRQGARFCSSACRKAAWRARQDLPVADAGVPAASRDGLGTDATPGTTVDAVLAELVAAGKADSYLGRAALALALRIDVSTAVMGFAALVKELRATMDAATEGVPVAADPVDELRARRERIFGAAV